VPRILIASITAALLLLFLGPKFIAWLRRNEVGQFVRAPGLIPDAHAEKQGTPTMGGLLILLATTLPFVILSTRSTAAMAVLFLTLACGAIGFLDDVLKVVKRRSLGLSGRWRMAALLAISAGFVWVVVDIVGVRTTLKVPIVEHEYEIGVLPFFLMVFLVVAGASNAVNLTDGLDGLAAGTAAIALLAYTAIAFVTTGGGAPLRDLAMFGATLVGACVGFLWFNCYPAAVFMGDTGSYALGGAIAAMAVMTKTEILLICIGAVFVLEALSVIIQVVVFKRFRRRVFLIAPIHHHFEMAAWSETKIITRFWLVALIFAAVGFTLYFRAQQG
jgi:phospho-N-acetylmuramoyl-pentapeptide-transferase